jgi:hypothetical protein
MEPTTSRRRVYQHQLAFDDSSEPSERAHEGRLRVSSDSSLYPAEPLPGLPAEIAASHNPQPQGSLWSRRVWLLVKVIFCLELGMLLAILPWMQIWNNNSFVANAAGLRAFLQNNFVRGIVTGLGLVDIWIGLSEAAQYRERRRN